MNSLKSVCSFANRTPVTFNQLEQQVEPSLRRQLRIVLVVRPVGFLEILEDSHDAFHRKNVARSKRRSRPRGAWQSGRSWARLPRGRTAGSNVAPDSIGHETCTRAKGAKSSAGPAEVRRR